MAAPNIRNVTIITGKTAVAAVAASATALVTNSGGSNKVFKVNSLYVSNIGAANKWITVDLYRSSTAYHVAYRLAVPVNATLMPILKDGPIYLEEGDSLRLTAETVSFLEAVCSYEEIS